MAMIAARTALRYATRSATSSAGCRFHKAPHAARTAPHMLGVARRWVAEIKEWEVVPEQGRSLDAVRAEIQGAIDAKPDVFGTMETKGLQFDQFDKLMEQLCPAMGHRERRSLFISMDLGGDGWIHAPELFSEVVLRVLRTRFENPQALHPVQGSYASLPRPPFEHNPRQMAVVDLMCEIYNGVVHDWEVGSHESRKGLYLAGTSGCGKTALLDVFFRSLPDDFPVVRLNWHEFTRDGFKYMHDATAKKQKGKKQFDMVADKIAGHCRVFLLDEFNVATMSEAILVKELFRSLWKRAVTIIITSNYKIEEFCHDNAKHEEFTDFLKELQEHCPQIDMSTEVDYRQVGVTCSGSFLIGLTPENRSLNDKKFEELAKDTQRDVKLPIPFEKRSIHVPLAGVDTGVARFDFKDLCGKPLGRSDYSHIATSYPTIFIDNIPKLAEDDTVELQRFVFFVDMAYDKKVALHTLSEVPPDQIYPPTDDLPDDERLAWRRCQSMLTEMQSTKYQKMAWLMRRHLVQESAVHL